MINFLLHNFTYTISKIRYKNYFYITFFIIVLLTPYLMMIGRSLVDFVIVLTSSSFIIRSFFLKDWDWLRISWVKYALLFSLLSFISGLLSDFPIQSSINGICWVRFPIFAVAMSVWILHDINLVKTALIIKLSAVLIIFLIMITETIVTDNPHYIWPFNNPLIGPYIHRLGILFFSIAWILLITENKNNMIKVLFLSLSLILSILSDHRVGTFSFLIIIVMSLYLCNVNKKRVIIFSSLLIIILLSIFSLNNHALENYITKVVNFNESSLLGYLSLWKTGLMAFINNPLFGLGPTNVQAYSQFELLYNYNLTQDEHPHNHYLQAFAETGIFGGSIFCVMVIKIMSQFYHNLEKNIINLDGIIKVSILISSICFLWPFSNTYDLYGQQQNSFLWFCLGVFLSFSKFKSKTI